MATYASLVAITAILLAWCVPLERLYVIATSFTVIAICVAIVAVSVAAGTYWAIGRLDAAAAGNLIAKKKPTEFNASVDDVFATLAPSDALVVLFVRHGESTANVENAKARKLDEERGDGKNTLQMEHEKDWAFTDPPLTEEGLAQAQQKSDSISGWVHRPEAIVCSPLTRAIQTAATVFAHDLKRGVPLIVRPELREYFPALVQDAGRPLAELRADARIRSLPNADAVLAALSDEATSEWREMWDRHWARGDMWRAHCNDGGRVDEFKAWLLRTFGEPQPQEEQEEERSPPRLIATVSHYATIHAFVNREPAVEAAGWVRKPAEEIAYKLPEQWRAFLPPEGGVRLSMPNVGHIGLVYELLQDEPDEFE